MRDSAPIIVDRGGRDRCLLLHLQGQRLLGLVAVELFVVFGVKATLSMRLETARDVFFVGLRWYSERLSLDILPFVKDSLLITSG